MISLAATIFFLQFKRVQTCFRVTNKKICERQVFYDLVPIALIPHNSQETNLIKVSRKKITKDNL